MIGVFINLGINNSVQRFYWDPATQREQQPILVSTGLLQLVCSGVSVLVLILAMLHVEKDFIYQRYGIEWELIFLVVCTILPEQILQYSLDTVRLHFNPVRFLIISFAKNLLGVCLGLWFVIALDMGLYGIFAGLLIAAVATMPLALWFIRSDLTLRIDMVIARQIFRFGYPFVFTGVAYWLLGSMDRWMLAELSTTEEVGIYSIAFKFAAVVTFVTSAFGQAWSPYAIKLLRDDAGYRKTYSRIFSLWFFLLATIGFVISLFAKEVLVLLTPKEYWAAANVLIIVIAGMVLYGTTQITALGISLEKRTGLLTYGAGLAAATNFLLNLMLIPHYGAAGAAVATLLSYALMTATFLYWTQRLHTLPLEKGKLLYCCLVVVLSLIAPLVFVDDALTMNTIAAKSSLLLLVFLGAMKVGIIDKKLLKLLVPFRN